MITVNAARQMAGMATLADKKRPSAGWRSARHWPETKRVTRHGAGFGLLKSERPLKNPAWWARLAWLCRSVAARGPGVRALCVRVPDVLPVHGAAGQRGQTMAEYSLVVAFIAMVAVAGYIVVGPKIGSAVSEMAGVFP